MTVYVDKMRVRFGRMGMCHMLADSDDELLAMADRFGVPRLWHQYSGTPKSHFDIAWSKRARAIAGGVAGGGALNLNPENMKHPESAADRRLKKRYRAAIHKRGLCARSTCRRSTFGVAHCRDEPGGQMRMCQDDGRLPALRPDDTTIEEFCEASYQHHEPNRHLVNLGAEPP